MKEIEKAFIVNAGNSYTPDDYGVILYRDGTREYLDTGTFLDRLNSESNTLREIPSITKMQFVTDYSYFKDEFNDFVHSQNNVKDRKAKIVMERLGLDFNTMYDIYEYESYKKASDEESVNRIDSFVDRCFEIASSECRRSGISYNRNKKEIIESVLSKTVKNESYPSGIDISFCTSRDAVYDKYDEDVNQASNSRDLDKISKDYRYIRQFYLISYLSSFMGNESDFLLALVDNAYPNRNLILENWTEFFSVCREYSGIIDAVNECSNDSEKLKADFDLLNLESNKKFMNDLDLLLEHNPDEETYYFHATNSRTSAQNILDKGLYMYADDLSSTTYPELTKKDVLSYEYGNGLGNSATYVVVLKCREGDNIVRNTTDFEKKESVGVSRRMALVSEECDYIVDPENIVGFIDRKKGEVVFNKMVKKDTNSKEGKNEK